MQRHLTLLTVFSILFIAQIFAQDQGPVEPSFVLPAVTLHLKLSASQQSSLKQLLAEQQDAASPNYHKWLTPEQYADRFGVSREDLKKLTAWLESQGFTVTYVARGRTWLAFSGTAEQVRKAFHSEIHRYNVNGVSHYANVNEPSIPAAFSGLIAGFHGLNDFRLKPHVMKGNPEADLVNGNHALAPDDFATIYDIAQLYSAGIDGTGQSLAIVGQTDIHVSDITQFRRTFDLPTIQLQQVLIPMSQDPGVSEGDLMETNLDLEWSGAVARNATIIYVYSTDVVMSLNYAVDQAVAPVVSMSYGACEASGLIELPLFQQTAQQANAEGMTWLASAGDWGAADCDTTDPAENGYAVDSPGSTPEVTSMGGSEFNEGSGNYWASSNSPSDASALGYIPEKTWNDTALEGQLASGGGGASIFFAQPAWQTGAGVPNDGVRHVPDLSLSASADHDGYLVVLGGSQGQVGGTSAAAPTMAGIVTLLNQYLVSTKAQSTPGLGNINAALYRIAAKTPSAFHDITQGNNIVPCAPGSPNCASGSFGYSAGPGYDQATGLGSPDVYNLVHAWASDAAVNSAVVISIDQDPVFQQPPDTNGNRWAYTLTLTEEAGIATTVTGFTINGQTTDIVTAFGSAAIPAHGSVSSKNLGFATLTVPTNVIFAFTGKDASGHQWSQQLTVPFNATQVQLAVGGASNNASGQRAYAPGMILSVYGAALGDFAQAAPVIPLPEYLAGFEALINNVPTPLYYVSPGQVNLQIPYETPLGQVTLNAGNPYSLNGVNYTLQVAAAAPGIYQSANGMVLPPFSSAGRGLTTTLFITGAGQTSPAVATGTTPNPGTVPQPVQNVTVTVGDQPAVIAFIGIPSWSVGVTQINYVVPASVPLGIQPVVVTVGGAASPAADLLVVQ